VRGLVETALPARMGTPFRWLVGSSWVGNLGDGIALAAGPLPVAGQTQDPFLVALGALLQRLPWLLFGLHAGVLADRVDRRRLVIALDLARGGVQVRARRSAGLLALCLQASLLLRHAPRRSPTPSARPGWPATGAPSSAPSPGGTPVRAILERARIPSV
jgi:hypothetical protein